jgi:hypothetical protein
VDTLFHTQLNDSRAQSLAAGKTWKTLPLSFFYSSEVSVDSGVNSTMLRILALERAKPAPEHVPVENTGGPGTAEALA